MTQSLYKYITFRKSRRFRWRRYVLKILCQIGMGLNWVMSKRLTNFTVKPLSSCGHFLFLLRIYRSV